MPDASLTTGTAQPSPTPGLPGIAPSWASSAPRVPTETPAREPSLAPAAPAAGAAISLDGDGETVEERYVVMPGDTFGGVALRHGMSVAHLAELNEEQAATRCVLPGQVLRVVRRRLAPEDEEARRRRELVNRFKRVQRCLVEEARYYLEQHEYDYDAATAEREADVKWEREHSALRDERARAVAAASSEAALLVAALRAASGSPGGESSAWPRWFRPWENPAVRRCVMGAEA